MFRYVILSHKIFFLSNQLIEECQEIFATLGFQVQRIPRPKYLFDTHKIFCLACQPLTKTFKTLLLFAVFLDYSSYIALFLVYLLSFLQGIGTRVWLELLV